MESSNLPPAAHPIALLPLPRQRPNMHAAHDESRALPAPNSRSTVSVPPFVRAGALP